MENDYAQSIEKKSTVIKLLIYYYKLGTVEKRSTERQETPCIVNIYYATAKIHVDTCTHTCIRKIFMNLPKQNL